MVAGHRMFACNAAENFILPARAELARITLAAAFVGEEVPEPLQHLAQIRAVVEYHDRTGAQRQTGRAQIFKGQFYIQIFLDREGPGCAAHENSLEFSVWLQSAG